MMMHADDTMSDELFDAMKKRFTAYIHGPPTRPVDWGGFCHVPPSLIF